MKNFLRVVAVVLVVLLIYSAGYKMGSGKVQNMTIKVEGGAAAQQPVATQPVVAPTTQPAATQPSGGSGETQKPADDTQKPADDTQKPAGDSKGIPSTPEEIVAKYNEVINATKAMQNGTMHKTSDTSIEVTDLSVSFLKGTVNSIVSGLIKPSDDTWTFTNGAADDGTTPSGAITPGGRDVNLQAAGVTSATCTPEGDGYKMVIVLGAETSTFDGTNTTNPVHHESCLSPLNLATLDISPAKITEASMSYPGATLTVVVDGEGRVTHYDFKLPMEGNGKGSLGPSLTLGLKGEMTEVYDITY